MLRVRNYVLKNNKIKNSIVIANISDIHSSVSRLEDALSYAKVINADIITIPGDLFDSFNNECNEDIVELLNNYNGAKIFISLGNHDFIEFDRPGLFAKVHETKDRKFFKELTNDNIKVLSNEDIIKYKGIEIMGLDPGYDWYQNTREDKDKFVSILAKYLKDKETSNNFRILLLHSCNALLDNNELTKPIDGVNLVLSGHNHAGITPEIFQGISKYNRGLIGPFERWFMKSSYGYWKNGETSIILSNGLTKMGKGHGPKWMCKSINTLLKDDIDVITLENGEDSLELRGKELIRKH